VRHGWVDHARSRPPRPAFARVAIKTDSTITSEQGRGRLSGSNQGLLGATYTQQGACRGRRKPCPIVHRGLAVREYPHVDAYYPVPAYRGPRPPRSALPQNLPDPPFSNDFRAFAVLNDVRSKIVRSLRARPNRIDAPFGRVPHGRTALPPGVRDISRSEDHVESNASEASASQRICLCGNERRTPGPGYFPCLTCGRRPRRPKGATASASI
jgi:hypothetical protein